MAVLARDLRGNLARFAPELADTRYGEEMWALYEKGELRPDSVLSGTFEDAAGDGDVEAVLDSIAEARREAQIRQQGREDAAAQD